MFKQTVQLLFVHLMPILLLLSCSNPREASDENDAFDVSQVEIEDKLEVCRSIAKFHSEALRYVFVELQSATPKELSFAKYLQSVDEPVKNLVDIYFEKEDVSLKLKELSSISHHCFYQENTRSIDLNEFDFSLIDRILSVCYEYDYIEDVDIQHQVDTYILPLIKDMGICDVSNEEQAIILTRLSIFEDSYNYWKDNLEYWTTSPNDSLRGGKISLRRGFWSSVREVAKADAKGPKSEDIVAGAAGGAAGGAVVGSVAGGVGAAPGAIVGGVSGGVTVYVSQAVKASIEAVQKSVKSSTEEEGKEGDNRDGN